MAELLKNIYSEAFFKQFNTYLKRELKSFNEKEFLAKIFSENWQNLELKDRMLHIATVLNDYLDADYEKACAEIIAIIDLHKREHSNGFNFEFMFFPEYIRLYGIENYDVSIKAIEKVTQFTSCEFVVRHFLNSYPEKMVKQMQAWAEHPHHYVRRLASEGMRTKLPWAIKVTHLNQNPQEIFAILNQLANDESDWVRKSVANSLNDLSKDFIEDTITFTKKWINHSKEVNQLLKHGNRTLLKNGHQEILNLFGFNSDLDFQVNIFQIKNPSINLGDDLHFELEIDVNTAVKTTLRIEYRLYFLRQNNKHNSKTFKIKEQEIIGNQIVKVVTKQSFKPISTRKYYSGQQFISLVVNGKEIEKTPFLIV